MLSDKERLLQRKHSHDTERHTGAQYRRAPGHGADNCGLTAAAPQGNAGIRLPHRKAKADTGT